jgi:hypothetical protein
MDLTHQVNLYVKTLTTPFILVVDMVRSMRQVYGPHGIGVNVTGSQVLQLPMLTDLDVGSCSPTALTDEQHDLFGNRGGVPPGEIVIYFVRSTSPAPLNGCAAHLPGAPAAVITQLASRWALGHEVGHLLGLEHVDDTDRLMTGNGTFTITNPPPILIQSEVDTILSSPLVKPM